MDKGIPDGTTEPLRKNIKLSNIRIVVKESMSYAALDRGYPNKMPFYLYGSRTEAHLDHVLKTSPNAQISADRVQVMLSPMLSDELLNNGVFVVLEDVFEKSLQPL